MLRVLRHYLPLRRALLIVSETLILFVVLGVGMTMHLWTSGSVSRVMMRITEANLQRDEALVRCLVSAFLVAVLGQIAIGFNELYDFRVSSSRYDRSARFVTSMGSALLLTLGATLLARAWRLPWVLDFPGMTVSMEVQTLVVTLLVGFGILWIWRNMFHFSLRRFDFNERVLILGAGQGAHTLASEMLERSDSGFRVVGLVPESDSGDRRRAADAVPDYLPEVLAEESGSSAPAARTLVLAPLVQRGATSEQGASESLSRLVQRMRVDLVVVALENRRGNLPVEELLRCRLAGVAVQEKEAVYERITGKIAVEAMRPSYLIFNDGFGRSPLGEVAKRIADLTLSTLGLVFLWPVMLLTALAVRLDSRGPALFRQERVGRDGTPFTVLKFRSMRADAEKSTGAVWATENDPRVTRVGRFLRKSRLDELPQLFNVLAGDMSLVGPRPERKVFVDDLERQIPYFSQRHIVKPGLTGWAQINYPYGNTVEDALQKLQYDLFYIKNQSLLFDLSILFQTIKTVVLRRGT
jgi:lipopolysaccharide/colanic/teichoic acid biosynthesis glycosyltransferase